MKCPCCRQELPAALELVISLETNTASARGHFVNLQPDWAVLANVLLRAWPNVVTYGHIMNALWGTGRVHEPEDPNGTMRTQISKLRKCLQPLGYGIVPVWHEGYRLVDGGVDKSNISIPTGLSLNRPAGA